MIWTAQPSIDLLKLLDGSTGDPRMNDKWLLGSPLQPTAVLLFYWFFVTILGPRLMKDRKPFHLRGLILAYNGLQIVLNSVAFVLIASYIPKLSVVCTVQPKDSGPETMRTLDMHYFYLCLKYLDLVDTIFFVLRKKYNHISLLHLHHHIGTLAAAWTSAKYFPAGQAAFVGLYNTFVHAVMYGYYFLTSLRPDKDIWWKKYLTLLQLTQHYLIFICCITPVVNMNCPYPKHWMAFLMCNVVIMIYLFTKFYKKTYTKKKKLED